MEQENQKGMGKKKLSLGLGVGGDKVSFSTTNSEHRKWGEGR